MWFCLFLGRPRCFTFWDPIEFVADSSKWKKYFEKNPRPYHFLNEDEYKKITTELGLKILHIETSSHIAKFKGKKGFEDYVRGWLPFLIDLPKSFHEQFLEEIGDKSLEFIPVDDEGNVNHPYEKIFIILEHSPSLRSWCEKFLRISTFYQLLVSTEASLSIAFKFKANIKIKKDSFP